jgi:2-polyprenyl-6-methoxyphenol hydroxylase-like FAD-dependent oxidoreductase
MNETEVIIAGSGPTGLMMAALLVRRGVKVRVLDENEQQAHETRAFGIQARSMELFLNIGLADEVMKRGRIATGAQIYVDGEKAAEIAIDDLGRDDTPYSFLLMLPQSETEQILVYDLGLRGVTVEHRVKVTGFTQSADGVEVQATGPDGEARTYRGAYLIGADGAHSIVRKTLGLKFEGAPYPMTFLLADCRIEWPLDFERLKIFLRQRQLGVFLPLRDTKLNRLLVADLHESAPTEKTAEASGSEPVTLEEVQAAMRAACGFDVTLSEPKWLSRYRLHHRGVDRYRVGRVFVAGDAAHIHSPAGGQGMNTGLQDAANLAWKLALVLRGEAPDALLDTYHAERWPVGQRVLEYTDRIFSFMASSKGWVASLRNFLLPTVMGTITKSNRVRGRAFHFISQLGIRYEPNEGGAFLHDELSPGAPRAWKEGLTPGHRAPNGLITRHRDVFDLIDGYRFHLLAFSRHPLQEKEIGWLSDALSEFAKAAPLELKAHLIASTLSGQDPRLIRAETAHAFNEYGVTGEVTQALFLVRPDGYIAFRSDRLDLTPLAAFLGKWVARAPA